MLATRAAAEEPVEPTAPQSRYVLGMALTSATEYAGSDRRVLKLQPLWAYQYGRFRISTSRAGAVLGFGADAPGPGASAELVKTARWRLGAALRLDNGRRSSDSALLAGLPDVRRTLRGRVYASYALTENWGLGGSVAQDLLGRGGGTVGALDIGYRQRLSERTEWSAGMGLSFANAQHMRSYFGVTDGQALLPDRPAFTPGAGLKDFHTGIGLTTALAPRWIAFASASASTLLGDAAASPLTKTATSIGASVGLAYRCCK